MDSITTPLVLINLFAVSIAAAVIYGSSDARPVAGTTGPATGAAGPPQPPATGATGTPQPPATGAAGTPQPPATGAAGTRSAFLFSARVGYTAGWGRAWTSPEQRALQAPDFD
jgi:hypothetical protein